MYGTWDGVRPTICFRHIIISEIPLPVNGEGTANCKHFSGGDAMKILVVDDEKLLVKGITFNLENEGYEVTAAYDGEAAVELAKKNNFDLIILDLMMPVLSGTEACMKIREFSDVPIIMLTARSEDADKLMGFACGADDYVTKPFSNRELQARVKALLRRSELAETQTNIESTGTPELVIGDLVILPDAFVAKKHGKELELTHREFELLHHLAKHLGQVMTREHLLETVWGYDYFGDVRTVDVTIRRLREKIEDAPSRPEYILTRRGVGYFIKGND